MNYVEAMKDVAVERFDELHRGINTLLVLDYPDHSNVGDSAIYLGQGAYWRHAGVHVKAVYSGANALRRDIVSDTSAVAIHGGGNLGGLYPPMERRRLEVAQYLGPERRLIQLPQSVVFASDEAREQLRKGLMQRPNTRIAARDSPSLQKLRPLGGETLLVPDGVHHLGHISSREPTCDVLVLARTDPESSFDRGRIDGVRGVPVVDWPTGRLSDRFVHRAKYSFEIPQVFRRFMQKSPAAWHGLASDRFEAGVKILEQGRTIVTDRLHGMLISLQMGRRVVAVDNNNGKLSDYASTWLSDTDAPLEFASDFRSGIRAARKGSPK